MLPASELAVGVGLRDSGVEGAVQVYSVLVIFILSSSPVKIIFSIKLIFFISVY
jgi:hypothetical protein